MAGVVYQAQGLDLATSFNETNSSRNATYSCFGLTWKEQWSDHHNSKAYPNLHVIHEHNIHTQSIHEHSIATHNAQVVRQQSIRSSSSLKAQGNKNFISDDALDLVALLRACTKNKDLQRGIQLHDAIYKRGLLDSCADALVTMYAKCGALDKAKTLLDRHGSRDVIPWTALIAAYARCGQSKDALICFEHMQQKGIPPNAVTFACLLKACGTLGASDRGKEIHDEILRQDLLQNDIVLGGALVDMYAKCGALSKAQHVLDSLPSRDVVSWCALITGYVNRGQGEEALKCYECMKQEGISPNAVTYACTLKACGILGAANKGKQIHEEISSQGLLKKDVVLGGALVDMYAKCGDVVKSQRVLDELPSRNAIIWCALIAGYAQKGLGEEALKCFERMQHEGIPPNAVTLCCVLNICSQLGLLEEGHMYFMNMGANYGLQPPTQVYACMVDLFGRAGHLEKAVRLIREMPSSNNSTVWHALLAACQKWEDVGVGRWAFDQAILVDKRDGAAYILMANIYAAAGMQESAKTIETMRMKNEAW